MPAKPTVSVVIPVKDDAEVLRRCLAALAAQTVPANEVVVVDNGSTDESAEVARSAGARVVAETEPGIPAASARGFDEAGCDVVAISNPGCLFQIRAGLRERNSHVRALHLAEVLDATRVPEEPER